MDTGYIHGLAEQIHQAGFDDAAEVLGNLLASLDPDDYDHEYLVGVKDAITTLVQAGATDPR
jgi:hypothetical protein